MTVISMNYLLEAGVHFGHQKRRWNPKMGEYIYTSRDDIYIIDLQKTAEKIEEAYQALKEIVTSGGKVLFVGTKKQAQEAMEENALRTDMFFVNERWLGGTLTNFKTIKQRIKRLDEIEAMEKDGTFDLLPKKEVIKIRKEYDKLLHNLRGIRNMRKVPEAMIIVDPRNEETAIKEARILNIPVFGIVDTNCDPDLVDYVIPANDDAVRAVKVVIGALSNAIAEVNGKEIIDYITEEDKDKNKDPKTPNKIKEVTLEAKEDLEAVISEVKKEVIETVKEIKAASPKTIKKAKEEVTEIVAEIKTKAPKKVGAVINEVKNDLEAVVSEVKEELAEAKTKVTRKTKKIIDYSSLSVNELKTIAKEKNITIKAGLKKADIIELLNK